MKMNFIGLIILPFCFQNIIGQTTDKKVKEICNITHSEMKSEYVESFRDTLKLSISFNEVYIGRKTKKIDFKYTETIHNESSIIEVTDDFAVRISIARVIDNGKKYYLRKIHLFESHKDCWFDRNLVNSWSAFKLGILNSGYSLGKKGTKEYFGYKGDISIE